MKIIRFIILAVIIFLLGMWFMSSVVSATLTDELISYWKLDQTSGTVVDAQGNNNGINNGATRNIEGIINKAFRFTRINTENIFIGNETDLTAFTFNTFSVSLWFNTSSTGTRQVLFERRDFGAGDAGNRAFVLFLSETNQQIVLATTTVIGGEGAVFGSHGDISENNTLFHVVVTHDGSTNNASIYVNGVLTNTSIIGSGSLKPSNNASIGSSVGGPSAHDGIIDEVGFWGNRVLSNSDITILYNNGLGLAYPFSKIIVTLESPTDNSIQVNQVINFTATATPSAIQGINLTNATIKIWKANGELFNETTNDLTGEVANETNWSIQNFAVANYLWNVESCGINLSSDTICGIASNFTLIVGNVTEFFQSELLEGQGIDLNMNITFEGIDTDLLAFLVWNNTNINPTKDVTVTNKIIFSTNFIVPSGTGSSTGNNITHYWRYWLPNNSTNVTTNLQNQTVYTIGIDDCSSFGNLLINYSNNDEDTITLLGATTDNSTIELEVIITSISDSSVFVQFNKTYANKNIAEVCVNDKTINATGFSVSSQAKYFADLYETEYQNFENVTLDGGAFPQIIKLFDLVSTESQEFLVTFKDDNFLPVDNAIITILRKYVGEGLFRTVEAPLTNNNGQALVHLVLGEVIYTIQVKKNNILLATFDNIVPFCEDLTIGNCQLILSTFSSGSTINNYRRNSGLLFSYVFTLATRTISLTFSNDGGINALISINGTLFDNRGNVSACSAQLLSSSGTLNCIVPTTISNGTIQIDLYKDNSLIDTSFFTIPDQTSFQAFGLNGLILAAILYITIPLMFITTGIGVIIGAIIGLIMASLLNLYTGGGIFGVGATIIWFIIAGLILIWKISQRERK